jgi:hypothetical protein
MQFTHAIFSLFLLASLCHAQHGFNGLRGTVLNYDVSSQKFSMRGVDGKEYDLRWTGGTTLISKKLTRDFANVAEGGQDASFLLGYTWRSATTTKEFDAQNALLYNTHGEKKARLPDSESSVITGILRPNGPKAGTLTVNGEQFAVRVQAQSQIVSTQQTIPEAIFRSTSDLRIWAKPGVDELLLYRVEFLTGNWPKAKSPPAPVKQTATAGMPGHDPPKYIEHDPAIAEGPGFRRKIQALGPLVVPKAVKVIKGNPGNAKNGKKNAGNRGKKRGGSKNGKSRKK